MRKSVSTLVFGLAFLTSPALAIECANGRSSEILSLSGWEMNRATDDTVTISLELRSEVEVGIRLIDATVSLEDVLGDRVGEFRLDRDAGIAAGAVSIHEDSLAGRALERLESLHEDDVVGIVCVTALVYDDGTIHQFSD